MHHIHFTAECGLKDLTPVHSPWGLGLYTPVIRAVHSGLEHPGQTLLPSMSTATLAGSFFPPFHFVWLWFYRVLFLNHILVLIFRSSCLWRRGRGSIRVSRKSQSANLQLPQTLRRPTAMMRYDSDSYFLSKTSLFSLWHNKNIENTVQSSYVIIKDFEVC